MPTANAEGRGRSGRYRKTRLAETFVDATLRFDLAPQRSPSACSEESLKIDPETSRWTPLGPTPQVAAAAAWPPTVLCPTARRARGARPECGSSFPKNIPRVLFPQTSRSGGERRGACKPSSVPASEAPFADNHPFLAPGAEKKRKKTGGVLGFGVEAVRREAHRLDQSADLFWVDLFWATFRRMPTAENEG